MTTPRWGDYPQIDDFTTIGEGDHIVAIRNGFTTVVQGYVDKAPTDCSGPTINGMTYSLQPDSWTFRMIQRAWHAPKDSGWYVSAASVDAHGQGSSVAIYRLDLLGVWYRSGVTAERPWREVKATSLPRDLRKLDFQG